MMNTWLWRNIWFAVRLMYDYCITSVVRNASKKRHFVKHLLINDFLVTNFWLRYLLSRNYHTKQCDFRQISSELGTSSYLLLSIYLRIQRWVNFAQTLSDSTAETHSTCFHPPWRWRIGVHIWYVADSYGQLGVCPDYIKWNVTELFGQKTWTSISILVNALRFM